MSIMSGDDYTMLGDSVNPYSLKNSLRQSKQLLISGIQPEIDLQQYEGKNSQIEIVNSQSKIKNEIIDEKQTQNEQNNNETNLNTSDTKYDVQMQTQQAIKDAEHEALDKIFENKVIEEDNKIQRDDIGNSEHQIQQLTLANTQSEENKTLSRLSKLANKLNLKILPNGESNLQQEEAIIENKEKDFGDVQIEQQNTTEAQQLSPQIIQTKEIAPQIEITLSPIKDAKTLTAQQNKTEETQIINKQSSIEPDTNDQISQQQMLLTKQTQQINNLQITIQQKDFKIKQLEDKQQTLEIMINNLQSQLNQLQNERSMRPIINQVVTPQIKNFEPNNPNTIDINLQPKESVYLKKKNIFTSIIKPQINSHIPACVKYDYYNTDYDWKKDYQIEQKEMMDFCQQILEFQQSNQRVTLKKVKTQDSEIQEKDNDQQPKENEIQLKDIQVRKPKSKVDQAIAKNHRIANRCKNFNTSQLEYCDVQNKTTNGQLQPSITKYDLVDFDNIITSIGDAQL